MNIEASILAALEASIKAAIEAEIESAKKRIESKIRGDAAQIASRVLSHFTIERYGTGIQIKVDFEGLQK